MQKLIEKIHRKLGLGPVLEKLDEKLSPSELNTLLLELFRRKAEQTDPARLLRQFESNRFVTPAEVNTLQLRQTELEWLHFIAGHGYQPLTLSPLTPLGTCSAIAHVDQNNVVSALRGTEVVSDATNVLALQIAADVKENSDKDAIFRYAAVHRHVRGQAFDNPKFTAHFAVLCLASGGWDRGNYHFELSQLNEQLSIICHLLLQQFDVENLFIRFYLKEGGTDFKHRLEAEGQGIWRQLPVDFREDPGHAYYDLFQFKVFLRREGLELDLADGGPVDWTQCLLSNRKHRLLISGIGTELVHKLG